MKNAAPALLLLILVFPIFAQEEGEGFDDLFEGQILEEEGEPAAEEADGEDLFETELFENSARKEETQEIAPEDAFLVSEQLEWGGSFDLTFDAQLVWNGYPTTWEQLWNASSLLTPRLSGELFFDARPDRDFRVFGKVKAACQNQDDWEVEIFELFSDFQIGDLLFFRAGKQTVQWGVGYFFSPADVLNLVSIDPEDPEAQREGPIAVKTHFPFAAHNAYLYLIANDIEKPNEIAVAPKLELLLGNYELGIGAFYKIDLAPKGMLTFTGPLWDLDLFAEAMIQWGSDRRFYPTVGESIFSEDGLQVSGTAGFSYLNSDCNLSLFAQYFFNGQGYQNYDYITLRLIAATEADTLYPGMHYLAASIGWSELLDSAFTVSLLYVGVFSKFSEGSGSGLITPTITWKPTDHLSLSTGFGFSYSYGDGGNEYAPAGGSPTWTLSASVGGGRF